jgi:hypothetical protein
MTQDIVIPHDNLMMLINRGWEKHPYKMFRHSRKAQEPVHYREAMDIELRLAMKNWREGPCFDLEDMEGFDGYREDLREYVRLTEESGTLRSLVKKADNDLADLQRAMDETSVERDALAAAEDRLGKEIETNHPLNEMSPKRREEWLAEANDD